MQPSIAWLHLQHQHSEHELHCPRMLFVSLGAVVCGAAKLGMAVPIGSILNWEPGCTYQGAGSGDGRGPPRVYATTFGPSEAAGSCHAPDRLRSRGCCAS
jgi:hypothetical protein